MCIELSICIPTYNRASILAESLRVLLPQCAGRPVEICISNNASTDKTADLLASCRGIWWETREENVGIDRNILAALRMARGRYVLPIGDDEMLVARGVDSILAALRSQPDMLILNGWHRARPHLPPELQGRCITDLREAFRLLWDKMPLGGFAIRREYAEPEYTHRYLGTHHAYSGAVWDYLVARKGPIATPNACERPQWFERSRLRFAGDYLEAPPRVRIECMAHPVVEFREVPKSWAADADVIRFQQIPRWFELIPPYYADAVTPSLRQYRRTWGRLPFWPMRFWPVSARAAGPGGHNLRVLLRIARAAGFGGHNLRVLLKRSHA